MDPLIPTFQDLPAVDGSPAILPILPCLSGGRAGQRLTIYVSAPDWALGGSQRLHKYGRLGQFGPTSNGAPWLKHVDVIDATAVDKGVGGHVYYGSSSTFLEDLNGVLRGELPDARGLQCENGVYKLEQRRAELN